MLYEVIDTTSDLRYRRLQQIEASTANEACLLAGPIPIMRRVAKLLVQAGDDSAE